MDDLTDLMRRATEYVEPESTDLVDRGIRRGVILRRRRSALVGSASASAVLAAAGMIFAGSQLIGGESSAAPPVAGVPIVATPSGTPAAARPTRQVTPNDTLRTLKGLVPAGMRVSQPRTWGDNFIAASYVVDDGKGGSLLEVQVMTRQSQISCANEAHPENCTTRPDGTIVLIEQTPGSPVPGVRVAAVRAVQLHYPDGRIIVVGNGNSTAWKKAPITRAKPLFTVAQLTALADSKAWAFPPVGYGKDLGR
ncbi:hypothetical protein E0H75_35780 [Kribbella capetownensis]|uniref:Uncharacterized protein n=1 Tax=Kribbella capetownensis TaxID=1572659 RepID=A0A4R0JC38_9ACTN|nr:hypothetical protein [Kribbella capetownensis]TCC44221.1 hypothetical protein E0H75_35780 [Kribbella capetownensis]